MNKLFKALAALLFVSFLSASAPISLAASDASLIHRRFVIYYGWYFDDHGTLNGLVNKIADSTPEFIISPYHTSDGQVNIRPDVMNEFHDSGIKVIAYIATGDAQRDINAVIKEMKAGFDAGTDGVMLDEVSLLQTDAQYSYYKQIYDYAKQQGNKIVIANPGSILVSEKVMQVSDIVSFEHQWRFASNIDWFGKYPASRFMGISSNDVQNAMGYTMNQDVAARDTIEAWQSGIGYHYSTDSYTELPGWFEPYQHAVTEYSKSAADLHQVTVKTIDDSGKEVTGLWIEVKKGSSVVMSGFSPARFNLPDGIYQIGASSYQNLIFSKWSDGGSQQYKQVELNGAGANLTALYRSETALLSIESHDSNLNPIRGMYVSVSKGGSIVAQGYTPYQIKLTQGTYYLSASDYRFYQFVRWDESGALPSSSGLPINLVNDTVIHAQYSNELVGKVGTAVFNQQCFDTSYGSKVAESLQKGGLLAGTLELYAERNIALATCASQ